MFPDCRGQEEQLHGLGFWRALSLPHPGPSKLKPQSFPRHLPANSLLDEEGVEGSSSLLPSRPAFQESGTLGRTCAERMSSSPRAQNEAEVALSGHCDGGNDGPLAEFMLGSGTGTAGNAEMDGLRGTPAATGLLMDLNSLKAEERASPEGSP